MLMYINLKSNLFHSHLSLWDTEFLDIRTSFQQKGLNSNVISSRGMDSDLNI